MTIKLTKTSAAMHKPDIEKRAAELHEGCRMPMEQAREIAASEVGSGGFRCIKPACDNMNCVMCNCAVPWDVRESVDNALLIVESYGPWGSDLNTSHRLQIVLADEVKRLRHLYEMAVRGRAEMRTALRQERDKA